MEEVELATIRLLKKNPFYGNVLIQIRKIESNIIPTAGITFKNHEVLMYINRDFFSFKFLHEPEYRKAHDLPDMDFDKINETIEDCQEELLIHEVRHMISKHIFNYEKTDHILNLAMDMAINHDCPTLPGAVRAKAIKQPDGLTHIHYLEELKKEENAEYVKQFKPMDEHELWESIKGEDINGDILKEILSKAKSRSGSVPSNILAEIEAFFNSKVNWKQILNSFFLKNLKVNTIPTRKKVNRRYGITFPGKKNENKACIAICVDTSGSVSDEELTQFFSEVNKIWQQLKSNILIIPCDSDVKEPFKFTGNIKDIKIAGRGGTCFKPALDLAIKHEVDGIIYFTDGDIPHDILELKKPRLPVLFAQTRDLNKYVNWGKFIKVDVTGSTK